MGVSIATGVSLVPSIEGIPLENVTIVNSLSDLPTPDGSGFIELGGGINTYDFQASTVDISPNKLKITGGVVVLRSNNRFSSGIVSDTTSALITVVDAFYSDEFMNLDNPNGPIYDIDNSGIALGAFVSQNVVIRDCTTIGTIADTATISLRTFTVVQTTVGGLSFSGTGLTQLNISSMLSIDWVGTLLDLGTTTWDIINITIGSRFISPSGTTILSGLADNGNLTSGGIAIVDGNLFNGIGTALSGIDTQDIRWDFKNNIFSDNTTPNSFSAVDTFLTSTETVTINTQSVYEPIAGTNWSSSLESRFTTDSAGIATYIGIATVGVKISSASTIEKSGGGTDNICSKIAIDTGSGFVVQDKTISCTENSTPTGVVSIGVFSIETGDKIQLFVGNLDSTSNIIVSESTMILDAFI